MQDMQHMGGALAWFTVPSKLAALAVSSFVDASYLGWQMGGTARKLHVSHHASSPHVALHTAWLVDARRQSLVHTADMDHSQLQDVKSSKTTFINRTQQCFAVKSGVGDILDLARSTFCRVTEQVHELVDKYKTDYGMDTLKVHKSAHVIHLDYQYTEGIMLRHLYNCLTDGGMRKLTIRPCKFQEKGKKRLRCQARFKQSLCLPTNQASLLLPVSTTRPTLLKGQLDYALIAQQDGLAATLSRVAHHP